MKKVILPLILFLLLTYLGQCQEMNKMVQDAKLGKLVMIDYCDRDGLQAGEFGELYKQYYPIYKPKKEVVKKLKWQKGGVNVVIVLGTWCSDSQEQVPKFLKVLDKIWFKESNLTMIGVNRDKKGESVDVSSFDIQRVPTFIFLKDGKEIGRIIETPVRTLEEDMLAIIGE